MFNEFILLYLYCAMPHSNFTYSYISTTSFPNMHYIVHCPSQEVGLVRTWIKAGGKLDSTYYLTSYRLVYFMKSFNLFYRIMGIVRNCIRKTGRGRNWLIWNQSHEDIDEKKHQKKRKLDVLAYRCTYVKNHLEVHWVLIVCGA